MGLFLDSQFLDSLFLDCSTDKFAFSVLHYPNYCKVIVYFGIKWSKSRRKKKRIFLFVFLLGLPYHNPMAVSPVCCGCNDFGVYLGSSWSILTFLCIIAIFLLLRGSVLLFRFRRI